MLFFSLAVLEGIAISFNPNYKVLGSSYPWIARKVLTDSSPKLRSTLQTLLYKVDIFQYLYSLTILNHTNC
jgi:aarF domain-containing kinase